MSSDPERLSQTRYLRLGLALMALKYAGDAALVVIATGVLWTPADYVGSLFLAISPKLDHAPAWLLWSMGAWALPFIAIGVRLTMRRAIDTGWTPWIALGFFVPYLNYLLMLALCFAPRVEERQVLRPPRPEPAREPGYARAALLAVTSGAVLGLVMIGVCVYGLRNYGTSLLLGTPYAMGAVSAYILVRLHPSVGNGQTMGAGLLSVFASAFLALAFSVEGVVCLFMASPLACALAAFGVVTGRAIGRRGQHQVGPIVLGLLALPLAAVVEPSAGAKPVAREVYSVIEIAAPPDVVWPHVVAFRPMAEPTDWLSRSGIAYPRSARIVGAGVGAIRYCEFSTGAFVEPITAWEPGRRLAFDVTESPPPLRELSPYTNVQAPHLDGFLRSRRGEFRLVAMPGGGTRLEGRTWYEIDMAPEWYWRMFADWMIHRIHQRVLAHIKTEVEAAKVLSSKF